MTAARILSEKGGAVHTVRPTDTLIEAAATLTRHKVGAAVVTDPAGRPVGVFSERDLARAVADAGAGALTGAVDAVMSTALVSAEPGSGVDELMALMTERRVRHVIIMDDGAMVGVVSIGDVVKRKIAEAEAEAESLKAYIEGA
ncbi:inosine-5-monophosphate dehydrogenase [Leptolyngbya valderiana BDU 20041]|nr:inosine-5-monophosphate dehydrogenase [Leptolyngbya valderiana BDU 20041]